MVKVLESAWVQVLRACREYGLTPSSRASLKVSPQDTEEKNPEDAFFDKVKHG
jgi:phage terminase small subunit